jgi:hypothetical protein
MKVWLTYYADSYNAIIIDKVFDSEEKAIDYIEFKPQMTGDDWGYFEKIVE